MGGSIGCPGLGVSGGQDSVIRPTQTIQQSVSFPDATGIVQTITETVTVQVT